MRKGLLFCGTEQSVFLSFDDGESWQPLRLNLPPTSVRDLIVKNDDLAVATHGRGFYILDDIEPLREMTNAIGAEEAHLFTPALALRIRNNRNTDTPLPPDEPAGTNPPDGAIVDYLLQGPAQVTLEILDERGAQVRRYSSSEKVEPPKDEGNVPRWWIRPARVPSGEAGLHRFVWDLHWPPPPSLDPQYPIAATPHDTPREPQGAWAVPGRYTVRLTVNGRAIEQPLNLKLDPRIRTPGAALRQQFQVSQRLAQAMRADFEALAELRKLRKERPELEKDLAALEGALEENRPWAKQQPPSLLPWMARLASAYDQLQSTDSPPTPQALQAAARVMRETDGLVSRFRKIADAPRRP
jgi:hypothetical protein